MTLIKGWRTFWRWWSIRLKAIATLLITVAQAIIYLPEHLLYAWSIVPHDIKSTFPSGWVTAFGIFLIIASGFAQTIRQRKPHEIAERESEP